MLTVKLNFGTLSRISTKLVCATHSCALPMALSLKLFTVKERLFGQSENIFTIYGAEETLVFTPESRQLIQAENRRTIKVGTRRGLFAKDTDMVLKYLSTCTGLYVKDARTL